MATMTGRGEEMPAGHTLTWRRIALAVLTVLNILTALVTLPMVLYSTAPEEHLIVHAAIPDIRAPGPANTRPPGPADSGGQHGEAPELWRVLERESVRDPVLRGLLAQERAVKPKEVHRLPWKQLRVVGERQGAAALTGLSSEPVRNNLTYEYVIETDAVCGPDTVLLIAVCSAMQHFDLRDAIRRTWGSYSQRRRLGVKVVFVLGRSADKFLHLQPRVGEESALYGDVVQVNVEDNYRNLTHKTLAAVRWTHARCAGARFLMKTDDDVFVNIPSLVRMLSAEAPALQRRAILGYIIRDAAPIKDRYSKWFTPDSVFRGRTYPAYASGSAYVVSGDLLGELLAGAARLPLFWLEDVYVTGMLARRCGAVLVHHEGFTYRRGRAATCHYVENLTGHEITAEQMLQIWADIHSKGHLCRAR